MVEDHDTRGNYPREATIVASGAMHFTLKYEGTMGTVEAYKRDVKMAKRMKGTLITMGTWSFDTSSIVDFEERMRMLHRLLQSLLQHIIPQWPLRQCMMN